MATVRVKLLDLGATVPEYATPNSAGADLRYRGRTPLYLQPNERKLAGTGIAIQLPPGYEAQVRGRSGLALKGLIVGNAPGTIDADYRGEVKVILVNQTGYPLAVMPGERIAQLVVKHVPDVRFDIVDELDDTERGADGFGSTGAH